MGRHNQRRKRKFSGKKQKKINAPIENEFLPMNNSKQTFQSLVKKQFWDLYDSAVLDVYDHSIRYLLLPQSVLGRAIEGHGVFRGRKFPEATIESIVFAIGLDPREVRYERQVLVNEFFDCVKRLLEGKTKYLLNKTCMPIYGVNFFQDFKLELDKETFKGIVLAGRMDSIDWRMKTLEHYTRKNLNNEHLQIGGGKEFPVNLYTLKKLGLNLESLAKKAHSLEDLKLYEELGIITQEKEGRGIENAYIRYENGLGTCDDAALIRIGMNHGISASILGFGLDATDTYSKFIEDLKIGGADEYIGEYVARWWKRKYKEDLVTPEECMDIIYFASKNNFPKINHSSSHRRFIQYEENSNYPTFLNHIRFIKGEEVAPFRFGVNKVESTEFYSKLNLRSELIENIQTSDKSS